MHHVDRVEALQHLLDSLFNRTLIYPELCPVGCFVA